MTSISGSIADKNITGLVLCGGESKRMGTDKAMLHYHNMPHYFFMYQLLSEFCDPVFVSCKTQQSFLMNAAVNLVFDHPDFEQAGPMTGLLSMCTLLPQQAIVVVGCDYPFFDVHALEKLLQNREAGVDAVCYYNQQAEKYEPLLAIYEPSAITKLFSFYQEKNTSLQQFLKTLHTRKVIPDTAAVIQSIDTFEKREEATFKLKQRN